MAIGHTHCSIQRQTARKKNIARIRRSQTQMEGKEGDEATMSKDKLSVARDSPAPPRAMGRKG